MSSAFLRSSLKDSDLCSMEEIVGHMKVVDDRKLNQEKAKYLLYLCQVFHIKMFGEPLFREELVRGQHGPLISSLNESNFNSIEANKLATKVCAASFVEAVMSVFPYSVRKLNEVVQSEAAFKVTVLNEVISEDVVVKNPIKINVGGAIRKRIIRDEKEFLRKWDEENPMPPGSYMTEDEYNALYPTAEAFALANAPIKQEETRETVKKEVSYMAKVSDKSAAKSKSKKSAAVSAATTEGPQEHPQVEQGEGKSSSNSKKEKVPSNEECEKGGADLFEKDLMDANSKTTLKAIRELWEILTEEDREPYKLRFFAAHRARREVV